MTTRRVIGLEPRRMRASAGAASMLKRFAIFGFLLAAMAMAWPFDAEARGKTKTIVLPIGKAEVVDLPRAASDVLVSDPTIVETVLRTANQPVLFGMKIGQANVLFFDDAGREMLSLELRVEYDTRMLDRLIRQQYPASVIKAESVLGEVVLTGLAQTSAEAAEIGVLAKRFVAASRAAQGGEGQNKDQGDGVVNRIEVLNEEQVHLKVQVAEVNRTVLKRLGVDWNAGLQAATFTSTIGFTGKTLQGFLRNAQVSDVVDAATGAAVDADGDGFQDIIFQERRPINFGPQTLDTFFKALEQYSMLRTLAEPSLTAVSGESASFLAGGEFPIPLDSGDGSITVEFKKFGVGLDFTPVVIGDGRISLRIATEVSDLSLENSITIGGLQIPGLAVRRANTTLEMSSGGTMVMAGLIEQSTRRLSVGVPGLRQVPILGGLFRSEEFQNDETELVILVTPYTVSQGRPSDFRLPTDGFAPASDLDIYLFGRLHSVYGNSEGDDAARPAKRVTAQALKAPVGYIVE